MTIKQQAVERKIYYKGTFEEILFIWEKEFETPMFDWLYRKYPEIIFIKFMWSFFTNSL